MDIFISFFQMIFSGFVEITKVKFLCLSFEWSDWIPWDSFTRDSGMIIGIRIPDKPGVYEAKFTNTEERLTIGKATNLRMRVKQGLVKGKVPHSSSNRIRDLERISDIVIRWAITNRPACSEEEGAEEVVGVFVLTLAIRN
ncbi:MAG: hypothetical protein MZV49_27435, partial [Rhodopseudomonas palustris]|nr:hypothetical protein [Rhodopseudomonas palustris]